MCAGCEKTRVRGRAQVGNAYKVWPEKRMRGLGVLAGRWQGGSRGWNEQRWPILPSPQQHKTPQEQATKAGVLCWNAATAAVQSDRRAVVRGLASRCPTHCCRCQLRGLRAPCPATWQQAA